MPEVFRSIAQLQAQVSDWQRQNLRVGLVPTMGSLHDGHLSLVRHALKTCERCIVSIFVNPKQFNETRDFMAYPRDEARDLAHLNGTADAFIPCDSDLYPDHFGYSVRTPPVSQYLEGAHRPGHFDGMATIVLKLLNIVKAQEAFFGEKDWQQLLLVRRLVQDFNIDTQIRGCPTVRDADGLAKSSRNTRLSVAGRKRALALYAAMQTAASCFKNGATHADSAKRALEQLNRDGISQIDYLQICDQETLQPAEHTTNARVFIAAWVDDVRLIDNVAVVNGRDAP